MTDEKITRSDDANKVGSGLAEYVKQVTLQIEMLEISPNRFIAGMTQLNAAVQDFLEDFRLAMSPAMSAVHAVLAEVEKSKCIERSGWLPHYTTPFEIVSAEMANAEISSLIEQYYKSNWDQVKERFLEQIASHRIDETGKTVFREALSAHESGLYRAVPRLLFPEIERIACDFLYNGQRKNSQKKRITGLPGFSEAVGSMPLGSVVTANYGVALYEKLADHLYAKVVSTDQIEAARTDPVPNRHATLHGILPYDQINNSINMLIMTDFIFSLIGEIRYLAKNKEGENQ